MAEPIWLKNRLYLANVTMPSGALNAKGMDRTEHSRPGFEPMMILTESWSCSCRRSRYN